MHFIIIVYNTIQTRLSLNDQILITNQWQHKIGLYHHVMFSEGSWRGHSTVQCSMPMVVWSLLERVYCTVLYTVQQTWIWVEKCQLSICKRRWRSRNSFMLSTKLLLLYIMTCTVLHTVYIVQVAWIMQCCSVVMLYNGVCQFWRNSEQ